VVALAMIAVVVAPPAALAAPNPEIVVGNVTISPADAQPTIGDALTVAGEWDATEADPQAEDTFTIGLPAEFAFPQSIPFSLMGTDGEGVPVVWGNCLTDPATATATCELTDAVEANPELVRGTWQFQVEAVQATTAETVLFDLNGDPVSVDLPGEGGIDDGIELPGEVSKSGVMNQDNWSMTWTVDIPGANMVGQSTVTMRDTLGAGHEVCDPTGLKVETVRGSTVVDVTNLVTAGPSAGDTEFDLVLAAPTGGFDANVTYRVTYRTCTPDGRIDPAGTTYDNSAQIQGWGDAGVGVGAVENRPWLVDLTKSGSVLGGGERNGAIAWTVVVPGDQLVGKDGFTFTESLGSGHEVCANTLDGLRVTERYGPSNTLQRDITPLLAATTLSSSAQAFQVRFDIDDEDLAFRPSDYRYVVTYTTCVSSDELPGGGTAFANEVDVDGVVTGSQATVPARSQGKSGRINTSTVTIDGVEHMPQTTVNWTVTIPGELIEDQDVLSLTDTLSATHGVCEPGTPSGGDASRLNLRVQARDQIQGGGLATVDLLDATQLDVEGQEIGLEIQATDLPIPTGMSDGFSREYQYVVTYTTCTTSGGMDAPGTSYGNAISGSGISFTTTSTQNNSGSGTGQGVTRGSVAVDKVLADTPGAAFVPVDAEFTVHVAEIDPDGVLRNEYDLQVPLGGAPVSGLNARGTGWTVELTEPTFPAIPGVTFGDPVFGAGPGVTVTDGGRTATAEITPGANVSVTLTNEALLGSARIVKEVEGGAAGLVDADREYEVTASIDTSDLGPDVPAQPDRTLTVTEGEPAVVEDLPIGATVEFAEVRPVDDDVLTWGEPVISPSRVVVTAAHAETPASITVTNTVERTVGTFRIVKEVTGDESDNPAVPGSVTVTATWEEEGTPGSTTLSIPTDGTPVPLGEDLLVGTQVTLVETALTDGAGIAWAAPVWSGTGVSLDGADAIVTVGRDDEATVTLENHAATSTAGISLIKGVGGEAAGEVGPSAVFPVTATWTDADGVEQSRDLTIGTTGPTPLGVELPAGTVVTLTEGDRPAIDTVVWGSIAFSGEGITDAGDGSAQIVVSDQQDDVSLVTVLNEASWAPGAFAVTKSLAGISPADTEVPAAVVVVASWTDAEGAQTAELTVPTDGTRVRFPQDLPHGTEVTLTETALDDSARFLWDAPAWSGESVETVGLSAVVTIGAATDAEVSLVNTVTPLWGSVTLTKSVRGEGASASADTAFPVTLSWTDLQGEVQTREVELTPGVDVVVDRIPVATQVRVEEHATTLAERVRWTGAQWSAGSDNVAVTTDGGSAVARVTVDDGPGARAVLLLENEVALDPALAVTGGDTALVGMLGGAAFLAMLVGVALLRARRRALD